jgi:glycerol-3-phosphate acyltransferase PlsY
MIETLGLIRWDDPATWQYIGVTFLLSYLLGSIPFGLFFAALAGAGDVRKIGSGNIGATNVLRTGKRWAALATLLCDAGKGAVAVLVAGSYFRIPLFPCVAALGAFLGHLYPVWLHFKGGKGVATYLGIVFGLGAFVGLGPFVAIMTCLTWLTVAWATRYSSLAGLISAIAAPLYFYLLGATLFTALTGVLAVLIIHTHRANIRRLIAGEEPRLSRQ